MILGASAEAGGMTSRLCYDFHWCVLLQDWIQPLWLPGCQLPGWFVAETAGSIHSRYGPAKVPWEQPALPMICQGVGIHIPGQSRNAHLALVCPCCAQMTLISNDSCTHRCSGDPA
jgi:hypothetical protein